MGDSRIIKWCLVIFFSFSLIFYFSFKESFRNLDTIFNYVLQFDVIHSDAEPKFTKIEYGSQDDLWYYYETEIMFGFNDNSTPEKINDFIYTINEDDLLDEFMIYLDQKILDDMSFELGGWGIYYVAESGQYCKEDTLSLSYYACVTTNTNEIIRINLFHFAEYPAAYVVVTKPNCEQDSNYITYPHDESDKEVYGDTCIAKVYETPSSKQFSEMLPYLYILNTAPEDSEEFNNALNTIADKMIGYDKSAVWTDRLKLSLKRRVNSSDDIQEMIGKDPEWYITNTDDYNFVIRDLLYGLGITNQNHN